MSGDFLGMSRDTGNPFSAEALVEILTSLHHNTFTREFALWSYVML